MLDKLYKMWRKCTHMGVGYLLDKLYTMWGKCTYIGVGSMFKQRVRVLELLQSKIRR